MCEDVHAVLFMAIKEHIDMHMQTYAAIIILRYVIDNNKSHNVSYLNSQLHPSLFPNVEKFQFVITQ